jgi:hypothetical protein
MKDPWSRLCGDIWSLAFEASQVMTLRAFAIASGDRHAEREIDRMIDEKTKALVALHALFCTGALGFTTPDIAARSIAHYRNTVRANRRRLVGRITRGRAR